jgi:hypothetical protein
MSSIDELFKIKRTIYTAVLYELLKDFLCSYIFSQSNLLSIASGRLSLLRRLCRTWETNIKIKVRNVVSERRN